MRLQDAWSTVANATKVGYGVIEDTTQHSIFVWYRCARNAKLRVLVRAFCGKHIVFMGDV